jgi:hypothetical protein
VLTKDWRAAPSCSVPMSPTTTGYRVWAACPCGASWERWVSVAEVLADLDAGDLWRVLAET